MSNATNAIGTLFRRWTGSSWSNIAEVKSITNSKTRETIDVTNFDSTGGYREFIGSIRDAGEISLEMNFLRNMYELLNTDYESDDLQNYEIVFPDTEETTFEFTGLVIELGLAANVADVISSSVTIKISGQPTMNSGASSGL